MVASPSAPVPIPEPLTVARLTRETHDTFTLVLDASARPGGFAFAAGQFNMLYAFGVGEAPISMSGDAERPRQLVHTIREVGVVTRALGALRRGDAVGVRGPFGHGWPLEQARGKDVLVLAGGLGLAPLRPAIYHLLGRRREYRRLTILYGARTPDDLLFRSEIERWRGRLDVNVQVTVDRADRHWGGRVGMVTALFPVAEIDPPETVAFLCGPEVMMRFSARDLLELGVPEAHIHVSLERSMRCGVGLCGHCQLLPFFVCKDGPVIAYDRVGSYLDMREV